MQRDKNGRFIKGMEWTEQEKKERSLLAKRLGYGKWMQGYKRLKDWISPLKGKKQSEQSNKKRSKTLKGKYMGKLSSQWRDGISFEPYSVDWTETLKRSIRERDHYICQLCLRYGNNVHHIDYNKKNCNPDNLITLCISCNSKVNFEREYWSNYFAKLKVDNKTFNTFYLKTELIRFFD